MGKKREEREIRGKIIERRKRREEEMEDEIEGNRGTRIQMRRKKNRKEKER